jgi:hypothetical protein
LVLDPRKPDLLLAAGIWDRTRAVQNQLWQWNGVDWTQLAADDPSDTTGARVPSALVAAPGGVYGFVGAGPASFNQKQALVRWTGTQFSVIGTEGPQTVAGMAYDPTHHAMVVLGSQYAFLPDAGAAVDNTYVFDGTPWSTHALPSALDDWVGATMVGDAADGGVLLWGGERSHGNALFSPAPSSVTTWHWNGSAWAVAGA